MHRLINFDSHNSAHFLLYEQKFYNFKVFIEEHPFHFIQQNTVIIVNKIYLVNKEKYLA